MTSWPRSLGHVIVRKMLSKMNGTISIESRPASGTTVHVTIPEGTHEEEIQ